MTESLDSLQSSVRESERIEFAVLFLRFPGVILSAPTASGA
jgi:hypothetical protein